MTKNVLIAGILGGIVMFVVMVAGRIFLPGVGYAELRPMPGQVQLQAALKERITEPGTYVCPYLRDDRRSDAFPDYLNEPVFVVTYRGYTHATVPGFVSAGMLSFLLAPMAAAWLLAQASNRVLGAYLRKAAYVATLGLFLVVSGDLLRVLTDNLPVSQAMGKALISLVTWTLVGLVLAWKVKPVVAGSGH